MASKETKKGENQNQSNKGEEQQEDNNKTSTIHYKRIEISSMIHHHSTDSPSPPSS